MIFEQTNENQPPRQSHLSWHKTNKRWIVLILASLIEFGNSYSRDLPAVLQDQIEKQFDIDAVKYNLLFSVYSLPNIIIPLFGGIFIDFIGIRKGLILFPIFLLLGQGFCMLGSFINSYNLLLIGRVIYGLGGENNQVVQTTIVTKWFKGREIAFGMGMIVTFYKLAAILNSVVSPKLYSVDKNITLSLFVSLIILLSCWFCSCLLAYIDWKSDSRDRAIHMQNQVEEKQEKTKISWRDITSFKVHFWMVATLSMFCYTNLYSLTDDQVQLAYQIPYYMGLLTPISGMVVDKIGQRPLISIILNFLSTTVSLWYLLTHSCISSCFSTPVVGQIFLGFFCFLMPSAFLPTISLCVSNHTVGTAFGIFVMFINIGFTIDPFIVGEIIESETKESYRQMMFFFLGINVVALILSFLLKFYDKVKLNSMLSKKSTENNQTKVIPLILNDQIFV